MGHSDTFNAAAWSSALPEALPPTQRAWLQHPGSLSARLRTLGKFSVVLVHEAADCANDDDANALSAKPGAAIWRRDVVLLVDDEPVVSAHSVTPLGESTRNWRALRALGTQPLADILYDNPTVTRSAIQFRSLEPPDPLFVQAAAVSPAHSSAPLWARRSVFIRNLAPLAVAECFLPALWRRISRSAA